MLQDKVCVLAWPLVSTHFHPLSIDVQVWDYVGDGYVHRLIQSQVDGKLVELPSPDPQGLRSGRHSGRRSDAAAGGSSSGDKGASGGGRPRSGSARDIAESFDGQGEHGRAAQDDVNMLQVQCACAPCGAWCLPAVL